MCQYEIGWCNLMKLNYSECLNNFKRLKDETKWSKCYYTYLMGVCLGAMGDLLAAEETLKKVPGLLKKKNHQIEAFVSRRVCIFGRIAMQSWLIDWRFPSVRPSVCTK
ncbi:tetratricopeptide repeat protein 39C-like, partial [Mizuhopecten yessoensis]|uniref:tetratricopeptide repeat protein 39C-like n=1 Tax=Mizuhopecten yessoensis TaxID=6573 RepID=UPI000B45EE24